MHISITGTCRGNGKVYTRFTTNSLEPRHHLSIQGPTIGDQQIPCAIYEVEKSAPSPASREFVAAFPILRLGSCTYTVAETNQDGKALDSYDYRLNYEIAKWKSRLNYRLNSQLCNEIRDYDQVVAFDRAEMSFSQCIDDGNEMILRGAVYTPYRDDSKINITCINDDLSPVDIKVIPFGEAKLQTRFSTERSRREFQFSIRMPKDVRRYIFNIMDSNHPKFNNFAVLDDAELNSLLNDNHKLFQTAQFDPTYPEWFKKHKASRGELSKQRDIVFPASPLFSIVVPIFNTPDKLFREMVESVLSQSYTNWELILVNASPENAELAFNIKKMVDFDSRIREITLDGNKGIAGNTNIGIKSAKGDFVCFFDHDDLLEPDLLFTYAEAINNDDTIDLLYCDEDKLMPDGFLAQPLFKPDFDIELLRSVNYICHMLAIRTSLLAHLEPSTAEVDGAQDHDLTLKAVEKARTVYHAPRVLYHWRITENSTAANADSKPYANTAGIKAVQNHLDRLGIQATVELSRRPFNYKVTYAVPSPEPLVSIIIPNKDHVDILDTCIQSILSKTSYKNYEIVIIENNSTEPETFTYYERVCGEHPDKISVANWQYEFNFSKLMNFGAANSKGEYLLLLNNDTEVITPEWVETMLGICARKEVGAVGVKLFYPDDTIQHAGVTVSGGVAAHLGLYYPRGYNGYFDFTDDQRCLSAVTAACVMTKRTAFEKVKGFTEDLTVAFNDIDYCLKLREQGYLIVYTPEVELYHYESISRGADDTNLEKRLRFQKEIAYMNYRWADYYVKGDPYHSINFCQTEPGNYMSHLS